ncbi:MAG TPA: hypothetical protein VFQ39_08530 [Longimicrobium sp.]|nr:hypothetical protein [Longimicrobium sp.]
MKTMIAGLALALAALAPAKPADYSGSWTLDAARSRDLPPYYANIKSHTLAITQDAAMLKVGVAIDLGGAEPDRFQLDYPLDGSPVETQTPVRTPRGTIEVPTTLRATMDEAGAVHITITRRVAMPDGTTPSFETKEDWSLAEDGRTLTIHRVDDTPRGRMEAEMVFVRT